MAAKILTPITGINYILLFIQNIYFDWLCTFIMYDILASEVT